MGTESDSTSVDFGPHLRQCRERSGLTLGQLSRETRIPEAMLEALESERLDKLPPHTYVRGFIRAYARAVRMKETEPLDRYERAVAAARAIAEAADGSAPGGQASAGRRRRRLVAAVLFAVAVSAAAVAFWPA